MMANAMVWGASGGIGRALVQALLADDWQVVAVSRSPAGLPPHPNLTNLTADVTRPGSMAQAALAAAMEVGEVQLWIYAVGDIQVARSRDLPPEAWQRQIDTNLTGAFLATQHSLPLLASNAHLVYLGAVSERLRLPGFAAYVAAKAGLEAFAAALAKEERGWRVTVARPGAVDTPFWQKVPLRLPKDAAPPAKVAQRILAAYASGHSGQLDLT